MGFGLGFSAFSEGHNVLSDKTSSEMTKLTKPYQLRPTAPPVINGPWHQGVKMAVSNAAMSPEMYASGTRP